MSADQSGPLESPAGEPTHPQSLPALSDDTEASVIEPKLEVSKPSVPKRYIAKIAETPADPTFQQKFNTYIERTEKGIEKLTERQSISGQEFDKQIVALAGGGLALTITLSKDIIGKQTGWIGILFASWGAFLVALTANLISHRTSTRHYNLMIERQQHYLDCAEDDNKDIDEDLDRNLKNRIDYRTKWVEGLNLGALIACLAGIAFFIAFTLYNKYHTNGRPRATSTSAATNVRSRRHKKPVSDLNTTQSTTATTADGGKRNTALVSDSSRHTSKQLNK